jgi:hypothetical protein
MQVFVAASRGALVLALALTLSTILSNGTAKAETEVMATGGVVTAIATVEAIDVTNRLLTVAVPQGNSMVIKLGPDVQNIETIKVKDRVTITYSEEVATSLQKLAGPPINRDNAISREEESGMNMNAPSMAEQDWVEASPSGDTDFSTVEVTDTVAAINYRKRLVTFAGTNGKTRTIFVDPSVPGLDQIQAGDSVVLLVTRAVAVNVTPV